MPTPTIPRNRLRELREAQQLPRHRISAIVERDSATIGRWERGTSIPDQFLKPLAEFFGVRVAYLAGWENEDREEAA